MQDPIKNEKDETLAGTEVPPLEETGQEVNENQSKSVPDLRTLLSNSVQETQGNLPGSKDNPLPDIGYDNENPAINPYRDAIPISQVKPDRIGRFWVDIQLGTHIEFVDTVEDGENLRAYFDILPGESFSVEDRVFATTLRYAGAIDKMNQSQMAVMHLADAIERGLKEANTVRMTILRNAVASIYRVVSELDGTPLMQPMPSYFNTSENVVALARDAANFEAALTRVATRIRDYPKYVTKVLEGEKAKEDLIAAKNREKILEERIAVLQKEILETKLRPGIVPQEQPKKLNQTPLPMYVIWDSEHGFASNIEEGEKWLTKCKMQPNLVDATYYEKEEHARLIANKVKKYLVDKTLISDEAYIKTKGGSPPPIEYKLKVVQVMISINQELEPLRNVSAQKAYALMEDQAVEDEEINPFEEAVGGFFDLEDLPEMEVTQEIKTKPKRVPKPAKVSLIPAKSRPKKVIIVRKKKPTKRK